MPLLLLLIVLGLAAGFLLGCGFVLFSRWGHKIANHMPSKGFSNVESVQLHADSEILRKSRTEQTLKTYRSEE